MSPKRVHRWRPGVRSARHQQPPGTASASHGATAARGDQDGRPAEDRSRAAGGVLRASERLPGGLGALGKRSALLPTARGRCLGPPPHGQEPRAPRDEHSRGHPSRRPPRGPSRPQRARTYRRRAPPVDGRVPGGGEHGGRTPEARLAAPTEHTGPRKRNGRAADTERRRVRRGRRTRPGEAHCTLTTHPRRTARRTHTHTHAARSTHTTRTPHTPPTLVPFLKECFNSRLFPLDMGTPPSSVLALEGGARAGSAPHPPGSPPGRTVDAEMRETRGSGGARRCRLRSVRGDEPQGSAGRILFSVLGREVQLGASVAASGHGRGLSDPPSVLPTQRLPTARGPPLSVRAPVTGSQRPTSPRRRSGGWGSSAGSLGTRTPPVTDATSASALGRTAPYLTDGDVSVPSAESPGRQRQVGRDVHHTYTERSEGSRRGSRGLHPGRKSGWAAGRATGGSGAQPNVGPPPPRLLSQRHPPGPRIPPLSSPKLTWLV